LFQKQIKMDPNINLQSHIVNWAYEQMTRKEKKKDLQEKIKKLDYEYLLVIQQSLMVHYGTERDYRINKRQTFLFIPIHFPNQKYTLHIKVINQQAIYTLLCIQEAIVHISDIKVKKDGKITLRYRYPYKYEGLKDYLTPIIRDCEEILKE